MHRDLPPLGWLRTFEAAARQLSFTGAARDLNMTQSAVSQQIKSLEGHLGRALFHRRPRALELTQAGRTYLPIVRDAFATLRQGTRIVVGETQRTLNIHCNMTFAVRWLAPRLPRFRAMHPGLRLNFMAEIWEPDRPSDAIDIEIRFALRKPQGIRAELLRRDAVYPICAPGYEVTLESLTDQPLYDCANLLSTWGYWAEQQALRWEAVPVTYASTYTFCLSVVEAGGGLMLGHDAICSDLLARGRVVRPIDHSAPMAEAYYLILSPQADEIPGAAEFAAWLRSETAADLQSLGREGTQA
ncbi:LysR substrate-binding domain-containing protein [Aestuariivita sp.]|jgi:LysR family glycine cleavage system transcriptional activator|uniref:LysR substrate-binding domain-containing protein n=1 Tax=Aestuariivita sp. TaxID=1872407 RepID=UPI00216E3D6C|nr:LysR substrate-binding domain-containing protein [Aestuariivita sp.]MCE8006044.1 LysR family transcriptional regulator [Aestuariivita sp.]